MTGPALAAAATSWSEIVGIPVVAAVLYSVLGILVFLLGFKVLDKMTPGDLWKEIFEGKNTALAVLIGCMAIGISIIIASAVHG